MCYHARSSRFSMCPRHGYGKHAFADDTQHLRAFIQLKTIVFEKIIDSRIPWYRRGINDQCTSIWRLETHGYPVGTVVKYHLYAFVVKVIGQVGRRFIITANYTSQMGKITGKA